MEIASSSLWTLFDVFTRMSSTGRIFISSTNNIQNAADYIFLYWPGKNDNFFSDFFLLYIKIFLLYINFVLLYIKILIDYLI